MMKSAMTLLLALLLVFPLCAGELQLPTQEEPHKNDCKTCPDLRSNKEETLNSRNVSLSATDPGTAETKLQTAEEKKAFMAIQNQIIGEWGNTMYPFEIVTASKDGDNGSLPLEGAFLYYKFREDGSYTKKLGSTQENVEENGQWELSQDGAQLRLHTEIAGKCQTQNVQIKYLQMDELVLEHSLKTVDPRFCTGTKSFYFNKQ